MNELAYLKNLNYKKVAKISVGLLLFSILFGFLFVPKVLRKALRAVSKS